LLLLAAIAALTPVAPASAQSSVPPIARGSFDARMTVPGTRTVYHRVWRISPNCLGDTCSRLRVRLQRPDGTFDGVTVRRNSAGTYTGRLRTRAICRGRVAKRSGTISLRRRVTDRERRDLISGRATLISGVGGSLTVESPPRVCPPNRHLGRRVKVTAERTDLPQRLLLDFHSLPTAPRIGNNTNTVQFTDASAPEDDIRLRGWNFGDPSSGSNVGDGKVVTHRYARAGTYTVTLVVMDRWRQVASLSSQITVAP